MAENTKDKDKEPTAAQRREAARHDTPPPAEREPSRAAREAAAADTGETRTALVGGIPVTQPAVGSGEGGIMEEAAANMLDTAARVAAGGPATPEPTEEEIERRNREDADRVAGREPRLEGDPIFALHRALAEQQVGEPITVDDLNPPAPGQSERGWSPEVTARHPKVLLATMEEIENARGGARGASGKAEALDPTDRAALEGALSALALNEARQRVLQQAAVRLASDRLAQAQEAANIASPAHVLAMSDAIEDQRKVAREAGHEV